MAVTGYIFYSLLSCLADRYLEFCKFIPVKQATAGRLVGHILDIRLYYQTTDYDFVYYRAEGEAGFQLHQMPADIKDDQRLVLEQENSHLTLRKRYCIKISAGTRSTSSDLVYQGEHSPVKCV